jgi:hypothetical protein
MVAIVEVSKKEDDFTIQLGRFRQAVRDGREVEASVLQMQIVADHGVWVS